MKARLATALLAVVLTASCSGSDGTDTAQSSPPGTSDSPDEDAPQTAGGDQQTTKKKPGSCKISDDDIAQFSRDWGRVAGAVGRPDLEKYTSPLVDVVDDLAVRAKTCPGASHAAKLPDLIAELDETARDGDVDMDNVNDFQRAGNAWLEALGYGESALPTG